MWFMLGCVSSMKMNVRGRMLLTLHSMYRVKGLRRLRNVLLIVTSHQLLGDAGQTTGLYLPEFAAPYRHFTEAGYRL